MELRLYIFVVCVYVRVYVRTYTKFVYGIIPVVVAAWLYVYEIKSGWLPVWRGVLTDRTTLYLQPGSLKTYFVHAAATMNFHLNRIELFLLLPGELCFLHWIFLISFRTENYIAKTSQIIELLLYKFDIPNSEEKTRLKSIDNLFHTAAWNWFFCGPMIAFMNVSTFILKYFAWFLIGLWNILSKWIIA